MFPIPLFLWGIQKAGEWAEGRKQKSNPTTAAHATTKNNSATPAPLFWDEKQLALRQEWDRTGRAAALAKINATRIAWDADRESMSLAFEERYGKNLDSFERLHKWREFQKEWPNVKPAATPTVALVGPVSYIYIFSNVETGRFKIGKANNVANRFKTAQTFASERLERVCERSVPASKVYDIEKKIHKALKHHRRNGEWFSCPKEVAIETMDSIIANTL
ncbi:MAG TPA: GIY-YIG nuclease family protein [Methylocella sp.]